MSDEGFEEQPEAWLEGLCADDLVSLARARVNGGELARGDCARVVRGALLPEQESWAERVVRVKAITAGMKGAGIFRKRLWVAVLVEDERGASCRLMARDLALLSDEAG